MIYKTSLKPLKQVHSRKLKGGKWVVLTADSAPLVVDEVFVNSLKKWNDSREEYDSETIEMLMDSGFFLEDYTCKQSVIDEKHSLIWTCFRYGLMILGGYSFIITLSLIPFVGIPIGSRIFSDEVSAWINIGFALLVSIGSTALHELMHIIYSRAWTENGSRLHVHKEKAIATVSMTHIWLWSFISRFTALSAGIILELFMLSCLSMLRLLTHHWMLVSASSILWLRILWQFRFHKNCDGKLIFMTMLDNPLVDIDAKENVIRNSDTRIWRIIEVIGYIVEAMIILFWIIPFMFSIKINLL